MRGVTITIVPPHSRRFLHRATLLAWSSHLAFASLRHAASTAMSLPTSECLQVKLLSERAKMPVRGSPQSAGFDLASAEDTVVPAGGRAVVKTDLSVACPAGTYARIAPRSGLAVKNMIDCGAGVVDADYRGNVGVVLFNFGPEAFAVKIGDRVAQLILEQISMVPAVKVEELTETQRGEGGFGSTGVSEEPKTKVQRTTISSTNEEAA